ncbi:MAG: dTDP-4-dehydrorhamnose reductase [Burkholderiales bacterium]|nr:dTDP-4-dehydrorhamnose reductase [Burkholderiales bacterium]
MTTILLLGKTGQVGFELEQALGPVCRLIAPGHAEADLTDADAIRALIKNAKPDVIVNAAGFTIVDAAESQTELAMQLNATAPGIIAECAEQCAAVLIHYSTTFVFDGTKREPYTEADTPNPVNAYGRSKLAGERAVVAACRRHLILRANWVYSARRTNFALAMLKLAREKAELEIVNDQIGSPTWARDYAAATVQLIADHGRLRDSSGIYHLSAQSHCSRMQWAQKLIDCARAMPGAGKSWAALRPTTTAQYPHPAPRPLYTVTSNQKIEATFGIRMPVWEDRIEAFVRSLPWQ